MRAITLSNSLVEETAAHISDEETSDTPKDVLVVLRESLERMR